MVIDGSGIILRSVWPLLPRPKLFEAIKEQTCDSRQTKTGSLEDHVCVSCRNTSYISAPRVGLPMVTLRRPFWILKTVETNA